MPTRRKQKKNLLATRPSGPAATVANSLVRVPAAVSTARYQRNLTFGQIVLNGRVGCRVSGVMPYVTVGASNAFGYGFVTINGTRTSFLALNPVNAAFLSPQLARLASCFTSYRWSRIQFQYHAMGSTASAVRLAFGYSSDYLNQAWGSGSTAPTFSSYNTIISSPNAQVFSPWMDWAMSVPTGTDTYYTYGYATTIAANSRQSNAGAIICVADADPGTNYTYGVISLSFVLDLFDPLPLTTLPSLEIVHPSLMTGSANGPSASSPDEKEDWTACTSPGQSTGTQPTLRQSSTVASSATARR